MFKKLITYLKTIFTEKTPKIKRPYYDASMFYDWDDCK